jgi:hypothetical protein
MNYMQALAEEIRRELPPDLVPDDSATSLLLLYALLTTSVGEAVTARQVHDAWTVWMTLRGEGDHPSAVSFDDLPLDVRGEDVPFVLAIRRFAERRSL